MNKYYSKEALLLSLVVTRCFTTEAAAYLAKVLVFGEKLCNQPRRPVGVVSQKAAGVQQLRLIQICGTREHLATALPQGPVHPLTLDGVIDPFAIDGNFDMKRTVQIKTRGAHISPLSPNV